MNFFFVLIIAFLLGGLPFGLFVGYLAGHGDIRKKGSGNIGATNIWRIAGIIPAILVFIGDIGKGVVAVLLCSAFYQASWPISATAAPLIAGIAAVMGHAFSPYLKFRGGKGVNTALGVFVSLVPVETLLAMAIFLVVVITTRYISLGSMIGAVTLSAVLWGEHLFLNATIDSLYLLTTTLLAVFILYTHRQNIRRLINGSENRFSIRKTTGE